MNEPLAPRTSFGIGGPARLWAEPARADDLHLLLGMLESEGIPWIVFGNGTNFLVKDGGFNGAAVSTRRFRRLSFTGSGVTAGAGVLLPRLVKQCALSGLAGLEFAAGIPASVGGAAASNAGGKFGDMGAVIERLILFEGAGARDIEASGLGFGYRRSGLEGKKTVIIEAEFKLAERAPEKILERTGDILEYRKKTQPGGVKSAGCIFKNPPGMSAGVMISSIGLSGKRVGGAEVSPKHANYIVNLGRASSGDVLSLMSIVEEEVYKFYNVKLEREVKIAGD